MTNLRELLTEAMGLARTPISDQDFIENYNRAVFELENKYDTAKRVDNRTIECTDIKEEYPLSDGSYGIVRILDSSGNYTSNYNLRDDSILFGRAGTYRVYEKLPNPRIKSMNDTPTINSAYNYPIAHYIASKLCGDKTRAEDLMHDYVLMSEQVNFNLKNKKPTHRMKAPIFR